MPNPPDIHESGASHLEVDRFNHVPGGRELALLRVEGRYHSRLARPLVEAALLVDDGLAIHRHAPLPESHELIPASDDGDWLWRAAFAVSLAALEDPETRFAIEAETGLIIDIDRPTTWKDGQRRRRRTSTVVARRAAAAAIVMALAMPTNLTAIADAAAEQLGTTNNTVVEAIVNDAPPLHTQPYDELCDRPDVPADAAGICADPATQVKVAQSTQNTEAAGAPTEAPQQSAPAPAAGGEQSAPQSIPSSDQGKSQNDSRGAKAPSKDRGGHKGSGRKRQGRSGGRRAPSRATAPRMRHSDGRPTRSNPSFFDALPGPGGAKGVPNFVIRKFRVPIFLLPIYQAAGMEYGIRWEILAAINEIETDYGRNLNVSTAGALGWMQFMPPTWRAYGVDGNKDGKKDPYNPVDAIFAAAKYLKASGGEKNLRRAIFAYNHANWYVDSVLLRAKLLAGVPIDVVGSLTGLTEGRFPVAARASYADDIDEKTAERKLKPGRNTNNVVRDNPARDGIAIYSQRGAPVVAVNDGRVERIGQTRKHGRYVVMQDVYGNEYAYAGLGKVADVYPVPKKNPGPGGDEARAVRANGEHTHKGPRVNVKRRVFAHPARPRAKAAGGLEQMFDAQARSGGFSTYSHLFTPGLGLNSENSTIRPLKKGSRVVAGTVLGNVGRPESKKAAHMNFMIRPAGKGAPRIDPKPILDGWKLLESTAIYRANGENVLKEDSSASIGQILMMPKPMLERRVLSDERINLDASGRHDVRTGQINRRVLAVLAFLAESGLRPTVSSLKSDHGTYTSSGNVSHHSSGNAVDISAINGIPIVGHQEKGGITYQAVRRLMTLQGTVRPAQIISLLDLGENTVSMSDHGDHIHVGFSPMADDSRKLGKQTMAVLDPEQWTDLIGRLREIEQPTVPTTPSRYALPVERHKHRHGTGD